MDIHHILESTSFAALDEAAQLTVREHAFAFLAQNESTPPSANIVDVLKQQKSLSITLSLYGKQLAKTNPVTVHYLSKEDKTTLEQDLLFSFFLFSAQYQLEKAQGKNTKYRIRQMNKCAFLLQELHSTSEIAHKKSPEEILSEQVNDSEKPVKYLGLVSVAPFVVGQARNILERDNLDNLLNDLNNKRRYWIWTGGLLSRVFEALSTNFYHTNEAQTLFAENDAFMNYLSWIVLYARWGTHLGTISHHVLIGATPEEKQLSRKDRLANEWNQKKYTIMQDSLSIIFGSLCAFWAVAGSSFEQFAGPLSLLLRILSLVVIMKQYAEKSADRNQQLAHFDRDILLVEDKISSLNEQQAELEQLKNHLETELKALVLLQEEDRLLLQRKQKFDALQEDLAALQMNRLVLERQLNALYKNKRKYKSDWRIQENAILLEMGLATGLLTGVCFMTCAFFPPVALVPLVGTILNLTGISICFGAIVTQSALKGQEKITRADQSNRSLSEEAALLLLQFKKCTNENERRLLYLDMKSLHQEEEYQRQLVIYQKMKIIYAVVIQALLPAVIFTSFVFMPAAGIAFLGAGFLLAIAAEQYLERYKPKGFADPDFDEAEYQAFIQEPTLELLKTQTLQAAERKQAVTRPNAGSDSQVDDVELLDPLLCLGPIHL